VKRHLAIKPTFTQTQEVPHRVRRFIRPHRQQDPPELGHHLDIPLGIELTFETPQDTGSETPEEVVVTFDAPLPLGATASAGTLSSDRTTVTVLRGALSPSDFIALIAALSITVPGTFDGALAGTVVGTSNHGTADPVAFTANVNDQPVVSGPVDLGRAPGDSFTIAFADLLATSSDPDTPLTVDNVTTSDPAVTAVVAAGGVDITVTPGFAGPVTLDFDVTDSGSPAATAAATASFDVVNELTLTDSGATTAGPGGAVIPLMDDLTGTADITDIGVGSDSAEAVIFDAATRPYVDIDGFDMGGGDDLVDMSGATAGFELDMGTGADVAIGGLGDDRIDGGEGSDTLTGGGGADVFVLAAGLDITDVITDYGDGADQIDLSSVLTGSDGIDGRASYDDSTGELTVLGNVAAQINAPGGGVPSSVEVIFEDASGAQATAVI